MRLRILPILFLLLIGYCPAQTSYLEFADSLQAWVDLRIANASAGKQETVQLPLCVRSRAWGCRCPDAYIGTYPNVQEGPFVWIQYSGRFPKVNERGHSLYVLGRFTGEWQSQDLREPNGEPKEWLYRMPVFKVHRWWRNKNPGDTGAPKVFPQFPRTKAPK